MGQRQVDGSVAGTGTVRIDPKSPTTSMRPSLASSATMPFLVSS